MTQNNLIIDEDYISLIHGIKQQIKSAQLKAHLTVHTQLIQMYWAIGKELVARQKTKQWGSTYLDQVSKDLAIEFATMQSFSKRNLEGMINFSEHYATIEFAAQAVPQLPWGHIVILMQQFNDLELMEWYAQQTIEQGWSRNDL